MFKLWTYNRNKIQEINIPKNISIEQNIPKSLYFRDHYLKDFKYISPDVLTARQCNKTNNLQLFNIKNDIVRDSLMRKWFKEVMRGLKQLFYGGSLHGVKYIFEPTFSKKEKASWIVIMVISIAICAVNIIQMVSKWTSTPFVNIIDSIPTPIWAVPFPTVVLCPHLHVKLSYAKFSELDDLQQFFASLVCPRMDNTKFLDQRLDVQQIHMLQDFLVNASPKCEDLVVTCNWPSIHNSKWENKSCCDLFQPIFTDYGLCYAFNTLPLNGMTNETISWQRSFNFLASPATLEWGLDTGYPKVFPPNPDLKPLRVMASGETNGLGLKLYLNTSEHQFDCDGNSLGFTILISSPTDHVYTSSVLRLPMDRMTTIEVTPLTYRTDSPLRALTPAQRQCFFQNEKRLDYYDFYTDTNCKHDLLVRNARKMCDCVLFNWPRKHVWEPVCSTKSDYECITIVREKVEEHLIYAYYAESGEQSNRKESKSCHPSCNDIIYESQVFYSDLTNEVAYKTRRQRRNTKFRTVMDFFKTSIRVFYFLTVPLLDLPRHNARSLDFTYLLELHVENPSISNKEIACDEPCQGKLGSEICIYCRGEVTQINVHFYEDLFLGQHRHAQYDEYYFVGAIGGLLSLFLGFSIISVAEIVYFILLRPAYIVIRDTYLRH